MGYLPNKTFIIAIVAVVVLSGALLAALNTTSIGTTSVEGSPNTPAENAAGTPLDIDGDGLKNWEERLMGTDPEEQDTDGDGTNDGDEIRERRNPLVAPPDAVEIPDVLQNGESGDAPRNVTDSFAREFLSVLLLQKGTATAHDTLNETLSSLFEDISLLPAPQYVTNDDIRVVPENAETLRTYGNAVIAALKRHPGASSRDALAAFQNILAETDAASGKQSLARVEKEYKSLADELTETNVPENLLPVHLGIVNGARTLGESVHDLAFATEDPLRASIGLSTYLKYLDQELSLFSEVKKTFNERNVLFSAEESGAAWNNF